MAIVEMPGRGEAPVKRRIVVDGREFIPGTMTGIGRYLFGLLDAVCHQLPAVSVKLAIGLPSEAATFLSSHRQIDLCRLPPSFMAAERSIARLVNRYGDLFISPYPKLPSFPLRCPAVTTVHDVHDITHPAYRYRVKSLVDRVRLQVSFLRARLTWFDSRFSLVQARRIALVFPDRVRVRHLAVESKFSPKPEPGDRELMALYGLTPGYILVLGNGMPHKNLGVLLSHSGQLTRPLVLAGVPTRRREAWQRRYPGADVTWIERIRDKDLPALMRSAFCLALPSTAEGYGYPPLEAMACGTPAVVSRLDVLAETSGGNALFAAPHDEGEWRSLFLRLEDPVFRAMVVKNGIAWTHRRRGRDGWKDHVMDIIGLLNQV